MKTIFRNKHHRHEPIWHVQVTILGAIVLQLMLPSHYIIGSRYLLLVVEVLLLIALSFTTPKERIFRSISRRINVFLLLLVIAITNSYALINVANKLLEHGKVSNGRELIMTALNIYLTNIVIFALCYWEMDGGGPGHRREATESDRDFMFPQNQAAGFRLEWQPTFIDYVYLASTNAMAFSPTDTLPLSRRAKILMLVQATISLVVIALVAARAVNILQ